MITIGNLLASCRKSDYELSVERRRGLLEKAEEALLSDAGASRQLVADARKRFCVTGGFLSDAQEKKLSGIIRSAGVGANGLRHGH